MEKKINERLKPYGLTQKDLSKSELSRLRKEIRDESKGIVTLDGVLSKPEILFRSFKRKQ